MTRLWPAIPASLALLLSVGSLSTGSASAAPLRAELTTGPLSMIEKVHGTHRWCRYSRARGWHRHLRRYHRAVRCDAPYYYRYYDDPYFYDPFWTSPGITFWFGPGPRYYRHRPHRFERHHRVRPHWRGERRRR